IDQSSPSGKARAEGTERAFAAGMRSFAFFLAAGACALLSPLLAVSCGGSSSTGPDSAGGAAGAGTAGAGTAGAGTAGSPNTDTCTVDGDCTWGEIPIEITKASDCMCLYGCGYLAQTNATAQRREQQHSKICKPNADGMGQACGIDDCAQPGPLFCDSGTCKAPPPPGQ
ncbi:MAG TPA: hypothetical protein VF294_02330, partial [Polyangiaceae bacterium]